jgi:diguanylate cyclase (GGDEF)-like protein
MADSDISRARILVIDDDPLMRRIVTQSLDRKVYDLHEADSGESGIELALELRPEIILLDVMMPEMDGFEVIRRLRTHPMTQSVPIVLLTALGEMNEKIHGMQLGADDYITKPFDPRELRARVQAHLKRSEHYLESSPLTSLPGNNAIQRIITARLATAEPLAVIYFDLSNFKSFNDKYGWLAGDEVIKKLGDIIVHILMAYGDKEDFVGHVGGDDFILITRPACSEMIAREVLRNFDEQIVNCYNAEDRARGYIESADRQGELRRIPLMTIAAAIVTNEHRQLYHPLQIAQIAAEVKHYLKTLPGSNYGYDRRHK